MTIWGVCCETNEEVSIVLLASLFSLALPTRFVVLHDWFGEMLCGSREAWAWVGGDGGGVVMG